MNKTLLAVSLIVALAVGHGVASAGLTLYIYDTGEGQIVNTGAAPFQFDGYTILSAGGMLGDVQGIFDNSLADMAGFPPKIGLSMADALAWSELSTTSTNYSEATLGAAATLQTGDGFSLGYAFEPWSCPDLSFIYVDSFSSGPSGPGEVICVPEPATMSLLALGGLALMRRRR